MLDQNDINGFGSGVSDATNDSGFYSFQKTIPVPLASNSLSALCHTRRGDVQATTQIYLNMQSDRIYQRNFYIDLPKNISRCQ